MISAAAGMANLPVPWLIHDPVEVKSLVLYLLLMDARTGKFLV